MKAVSTKSVKGPAIVMVSVNCSLKTCDSALTNQAHRIPLRLEMQNQPRTADCELHELGETNEEQTPAESVVERS